MGAAMKPAEAVPGQEPVLSAAFFRLYDDLSHNATGVDDAQKHLQETKQQRQTAQERLSQYEKDLQWMHRFVKEQEDRIELVSKHWFYGTTMFQPQLWLRGGCKGKIDRAKVKLIKAQQDDLPKLLQHIRRMETVELPLVESQVEHQSRRFLLASNAASEREVMKQRALSEYPSPLLLQLSDQTYSLQKQIKTSNQETKNIESVISRMKQAQKICRQAQSHLDDALKHHHKYETFNNTLQSMPRPNDVRRPHQGNQEIRVQTMHHDDEGRRYHHQRHCQRVRGCDHRELSTDLPRGRNAEETQNCSNVREHYCRNDQHQWDRREGFSSTESHYQGNLAELQKQRHQHECNMERQNKACNRSISEAQGTMRQAGEMSARALGEIDLSVQERYASLRALLNTGLDPLSSSSYNRGCRGYGLSYSNRVSEIQRESELVARHQDRITQQLGTIQQVHTKLWQELQDLKTRNRNTKSRLEDEENRILDELRSRVTLATDTTTTTTTGTTHPTPTAPPASYDPNARDPLAPCYEATTAPALDRSTGVVDGSHTVSTIPTTHCPMATLPRYDDCETLPSSDIPLVEATILSN